MANKHPRFNYTPIYLTRDILNQPHEIYVFGSSIDGIHQVGQALTAKTEFNAIDGVAMGLQQKCYGVVVRTGQTWQQKTVDYRQHMLSLIRSQIFTLYQFARLRPELHFYVAPIGCDQAGFYAVDIGPLFYNSKKPDNVILPQSFRQTV